MVVRRVPGSGIRTRASARAMAEPTLSLSLSLSTSRPEADSSVVSAPSRLCGWAVLEEKDAVAASLACALSEA
eukprot:124891-Rhodomonas_salina.1